MKSFRYFLFAICVYGATAAVVRKQPAFATPIYSDSFLPASMQVIFHIVDQLKRMEIEDFEQNQLQTPSTSPHPPGQKQPLPAAMETTIDTIEYIETVTVADEEKYYVPPEIYQEEALIISRPDSHRIVGIEDQVTPEVNHEQSELVYGRPETNYEIPETNHELPEETNENRDGDKSEINCNEKNSDTLTVDSVVKEIYSIVKTSSSSIENSNSTVVEEKKKLADRCTEGKNSAVQILAVEDNKERSEELKDDERFTLLGEKVDQVPRPSLMAFLKASNTTSNPSLQQLGDLYDALSRDARRQGFSKYAGYSDKVLKYLEGSAGGSAGLQLKGLLEKSQGNNELTRYDAMQKTKEIIGVLDDDSSRLSTDLRRILPLRFIH